MKLKLETFLKYESLICATLIVVLSVVGYGLLKASASADNGGHDRDRDRQVINSITADFRITKADGVKSLLQLMAEQNPQAIPPERKIKSLYVVVSAERDNLILTSPAHTPGEFEMIVSAGDDKLFPLSPIPFFAEEALGFTFAATNGVCDFFVHIELVPR